MKSGTKEYRFFHRKIEQAFGKPKYCEWCGSSDKRRYEWAHIHETEWTIERTSWVRLCVSCHRSYDAPFNPNACNFGSKVKEFWSDPNMKAKMVDGRKGRLHSEETKEKMRISQQLRRAKEAQ